MVSPRERAEGPSARRPRARMSRPAPFASGRHAGAVGAAHSDCGSCRCYANFNVDPQIFRSMMSVSRVPVMLFTISISEKGAAERRETFDKNEIYVGNDPGNEVMLPKGDVSGWHARILARDGRFIVSDLRSRHGTYVNGRKIAEATIVREGTRSASAPSFFSWPSRRTVRGTLGKMLTWGSAKRRSKPRARR